MTMLLPALSATETETSRIETLCICLPARITQ